MKRSTRALKAIALNEGRVMTIRSKGFVEKEGQDLCEYCAFSEPFEKFEECWVDRSSKDGLMKNGISQIITHCSMHQPVISFDKNQLSGLEGTFNTFRPGVAWQKRLVQKQVVGLSNSNTDKLFCKASVVGVECGRLDGMLEKHAKMNHLILADPSKDLSAVMIRLYGPHIIQDESMVSVITMKRI